VKDKQRKRKRKGKKKKCRFTRGDASYPNSIGARAAEAGDTGEWEG